MLPTLISTKVSVFSSVREVYRDVNQDSWLLSELLLDVMLPVNDLADGGDGEMMLVPLLDLEEMVR